MNKESYIPTEAEVWMRAVASTPHNPGTWGVDAIIVYADKIAKAYSERYGAKESSTPKE